MVVVRATLAEGRELVVATSPLNPSKLLAAFVCLRALGRSCVVICCHIGNLPDHRPVSPWH